MRVTSMKLSNKTLRKEVVVPKTLTILALPRKPRFLGGFDIVYRGQPKVTIDPQK